ncbi:MAG: homocysteine methyltransferase [Ruminococcaceae bacterium]|nr:homocysteine methyltransferase [Oscillospiraceae bacterium]
MNILDYVKNYITFLDGGMGTLLQSAGLKPGEKPELWNITNPEVIQKIHCDYFDAGSNIVVTNTFGANTLKFSEEELEKIIFAAVENARIAKEKSVSAKEKFIALDIGPLGKLLKPLGDMDFETAVSIFAQTVKIGVSAGVDLIFIETMTDSLETKAALLAAKENTTLPVFVSNAYGEDSKLMTGASPEAMVYMLEGMGADAIGLNCSYGPKEMSETAKRIVNAASIPVLFKPNAGLPEEIDGKTVFNVSPMDFATQVREAVKNGVRIIGGCCGTTPEYIKALNDLIADVIPLPVEKKDTTAVTSYTKAVVFDSKPILIGERINPTGKKRFKQALIENDIDYILQEGINQQDKGVDILDVNVGLPDIDEKEMLKTAVFELQAVSDLPLQIDTSDVSAMESALRIYNGKAMINSVNGKQESMDAVFPLVKKYGGVVVALTLDENGIPETAEERYKIAEKIVKTAESYGIEKKNIIFDTLAMTVSADPNAANATLKSLNMIKNKLGCKTSLGVSNVSFGLPNRDYITSTFFALALSNGLDAAIMNPYSFDMMKTYRAYCALTANDENFAEYIEFCENTEEITATAATTKAKTTDDASSELQKAIIHGRKEQAAEMTKELLKTTPPLDIVNNDIIPALNKVGKDFENKITYLPGLLMSAEASKFAFEQIKQAITSSGATSNKNCTVVIATVKGDIHDIGKNIVKLLLENYNFNVIDLGKDVTPEVIIEAAISSNAKAVALSALMTTTVGAMADTIALLKEKNIPCKTIVGGAVLTEEYAKKIGADKYAKDAMEAVRYCNSID